MIEIIYDKVSLIEKLREIRAAGWIEGRRHGNVGSVGNTLEDLLGIEENNLPLPNAAEWELKCQRKNSNALTTLFHLEPSPTALKFVSNVLLPQYGWAHKEAGSKYPLTEKSFRQTISALGRSDRGFGVIVDKIERKILVSFDASKVAARHWEWLRGVKHNVGLGELAPQPYWGFGDLYHKAGTKLHNCFYIIADEKVENGKEFFKYEKIMKLSHFSLDRFIESIENGYILVDFDARSGHNHGTKFRFRNSKLPSLYSEVENL